MKIYPAIDIKDGRCVRLSQGKFDEVEIFSNEPFEMAKKWESLGASYIHLVDLDGARFGASTSDDVIKKIIENINIPVQVGGGIRTIEDIENKFKLGVDRVILGTVAISNPDLVKHAIDKFGSDKVCVGIDAKNGFVAVNGWEEVSEVKALVLCQQMENIGVKTIIYTDISKDGMKSGPNIIETKELIDNTNLNIITSGGVTTNDDLEDVKNINSSGVIIGKAIYEDLLNLKDVIEKYER